MSHFPFPDMVATSSSFWLDFCTVSCFCILIRGYSPAPRYKEVIFGHLKLNPVTYPTLLCAKVNTKYWQKTGMWFWSLEQIPAVSKFNRNFVKQTINLLLLIISALCSQSRNVMEWALQLLVNYVVATDKDMRNLYTVFCALTTNVSGQHRQVSVNKGILCNVSVYKLCQVKKKVCS